MSSIRVNALLLFMERYYETVCVTLSIAQNIAKANHKTNTQAIRIAIGSIHFVRFKSE